MIASDSGTRRQRVPALSPEERRAALIAATIPLLRGLKAIDPQLPLRRRLVAAAHLIRDHVAGHGALFFVVRGPLFMNDRSRLVELRATRFLILNELTLLIEPDARLLRRSPAIAARLLLSLVGAPRGAFGALDEALDDEEAVSVVLDGLLVHPHTADSSTMEDSC